MDEKGRENLRKKHYAYFTSIVIQCYLVGNKFDFSTAGMENGTMNLHLKKTVST